MRVRECYRVAFALSAVCCAHIAAGGKDPEADVDTIATPAIAAAPSAACSAADATGADVACADATFDSMTAATAGAYGRTSARIGQFYREVGTNPPWSAVQRSIPRYKQFDGGYKGSKIIVDRSLFSGMRNSRAPFTKAFRLHTIAHPAVGRKYLHLWSRWYQESGNTQVFRLFKGEENWRSRTSLRARTEAASSLQYPHDRSQVWEFSAIVTIVKPSSFSLFQLFSTGQNGRGNTVKWGMQVTANKDGRFRINHRKGNDVYVPGSRTGVPTHFAVRDNGRYYSVYINNRKVTQSFYDRPSSEKTRFRWGMYVGESRVHSDGMLWFTGTTIKQVARL